ncbi:MAG: acetolactate synthase small subunit [Oscillospiraceae bacterium]|nr:acetolactate synthase small subunit [Oscillospiraceae bacterium]
MQHHTISALVENSAGVLSQVSRLFSRKGYNIESLAVGVTDDPAISRITIIMIGDDLAAKQMISQFRKLRPVIYVQEMDAEQSVHRELLLVKVKTETKDARDEVIQISNIFRANIIDVSRGALTLSITGDTEKNNALIKLLEEFGILELARTGIVALERGPYTIHDENK